jgi:hypothetical protein
MNVHVLTCVLWILLGVNAALNVWIFRILAVTRRLHAEADRQLATLTYLHEKMQDDPEARFQITGGSRKEDPV